jgi:hypothetical protein
VRGLPQDVTAEKLAQVFGAFGPLRGGVNLKLQKGKEPFAFIDYEDGAAQKAAIAGPAMVGGQQVLPALSPSCLLAHHPAIEDAYACDQHAPARCPPLSRMSCAPPCHLERACLGQRCPPRPARAGHWVLGTSCCC